MTKGRFPKCYIYMREWTKEMQRDWTAIESFTGQMDLTLGLSKTRVLVYQCRGQTAVSIRSYHGHPCRSEPWGPP